MDVIPVVDEGLGTSAYVVDLGDGGALVVDPERDSRPYLGERGARGLVPRFVVETHLQADFVSGGRELTAAGAQLLAPAGSQLAFDHRPLRDGDELELGGLTLEVIATPGHTPEHLAYLLRDGSRPVALFSGGTLMAGGVARPDLLSAEQTEPLARAAYRSIHQRLLTLPDELAVFPTHGGGSFCSVAGGGERDTTIGRERASNPLLVGDPDEDAFVARLLGGLGSYPPYFLELRAVNRADPTVHGPMPPLLAQLDLDGFDQAVADGAEVVDVRQASALAGGHVPGSLSNPWRGQFATWLGWLVGELAGGVDAWRAAGRALATTPLVEAADTDGRQVLDIRQQSEFTAGHVPGALHVELGTLATTAEGLPATSLLLHCGHGERAMSAASLLQRAGHDDVAVLAGGPDELGELETGARG